MQEKTKKILSTGGFAALFVFSFLFFFYFTFPYNVLKESIAAEIGKLSGLNIRVAKLSPAFPLGFSLQNIEISMEAGGPSLEFAKMRVGLSVLNLLIARIGIDVSVTAKGGGTVEFGSRTGIFQMLFSRNMIPSSVDFTARKFPIDGIMAFILDRASKQQSVSPLIAPLLSQITVQGALDGKADLDLDTKDPTRSNGLVNLTILGGKLVLSDKSLNIADQEFKRAAINANLTKGQLVFEKDPGSGVSSQEFSMDIFGKINLKPNLMTSILDLTMSLRLDGGLKDVYGFIIDAVVGGQGGKAKMQILGTLGDPKKQTL